MKKNFILILISLVITLITLVTVSLIIKNRLKDATLYDDAVMHTHMVINQLHHVESLIKDVETGTRGYLLTGDSTFLFPYLSSIKKVDIALDSLQFLLSDDRSQLNRLILLQVDIKEKMGIMAYTNFLKSKNQLIGVTDDMRRGNYLMTQIRAALLTMVNIEGGLLAIRKTQREKYEGITPGYLSFSLGVSLAITIICFFFILREFKIRAGYQKKLEKSVEELNQRNSELEQIAEISSHDLQEPLRKLRLFSSKLLYNSKSLLDDSTKSSIERIDVAAQRMQSLIDDVVTYHNISNPQINKESIDLNTIVTDVTRAYVANNALEIFVETLPSVEGDTAQLKLVFKHLLENAIKYAKPTIAPFVKIKYELIDGSAFDTSKQDINYHLITVSDNGIGFNEEYAHKLFAIFRRLHGQEASYKGKGIGLAICKKIMFNHNGYITANGRENEGATFNLYLPLKPNY